MRLFKAQGKTSPIAEIAQTLTDVDGRFAFSALTPPRPDDQLDPLIYLVFADAENRPIGAGGIWTGQGVEKNSIEIRVLRDKAMLSGTVVDARGHPVAGATVAEWAIDGRPVPGILSATSRPDGRFVITRIPHYEWMRAGSKDRSGLTFTVSHPSYPETILNVRELPRNVTVTLRDGCRVTGSVTDRVTGQPAAGAVVVAERLGEHSRIHASTNAAGRFEMVLAEDNYNFAVNAKDRVCVAMTEQECLTGKELELPSFELINGGFISGQVLNASTGEAITVGPHGNPIVIGLFGPSHPLGKVIAPARMATVDSTGRFTLRAAPGENFPYFVNFQGDRMGWDTTKQPPVEVKEGRTTDYNMMVTPKVPPEQKLRAARKLVDSLSIKPFERTEQILVEFRKLNHTVDETELWCTLMRELVGVGRDAVPQLCTELDRSTEDRMLRRLGFALRAIGDPRAVPALLHSGRSCAARFRSPCRQRLPD